ncbi:uncharacterized protein LOC123869984 isoform X6 [Maniola jurtina]|uniref:uncharacterized protein LOC123869984 isoform X6 n=1 Tax=Maniola jurtina TaxID=191418 RepID=UPI001E687AE2|nr:uncharacterized protein LOC123869984 isoform X6 [Maniola jurtina]
MNRNQRMYYSRVSKNADEQSKIRARNDLIIEEVLPPKNKRNPFKDKTVADRSCYIKPNLKDAEQSVDNHSLDLHFKDLIKQQYDFDPLVFPDTIKNLKELQKALCSSQSTNTKPLSQSYEETIDDSQWQNVDNTVDLEQILGAEKKDVPIPKTIDSKNIYISEVPRIKVIAEKFSKFSKNNVELRKLEEKIVCIEYDIFESILSKDELDFAKPVQKMRAYFSVKPTNCTDGEKTVTVLPSTIKHKFHITDDDLEKLNEKEIEILDEKIAENKPYLDELKRVLKKKQAIYAKKNNRFLDLKSLYEMAKRETPSLDEDFSNTNLLSKAELEEIKELITKNGASSMHGINRRTLKCNKDLESKDETACMNVISKSIFAELIRNDACI